MQWSRVKTILIVILLLVDSFLLCMLGGKAIFAHHRKREMRQHIQTVLKKNDVTLAADMEIPETAMLPQLYIDRNRTKESEMAAALLGEAVQRSEDGEESRFESPKGTVVWNEKGEVQALIKDYDKPGNIQLRTGAESLLQKAGMLTPGLEWQVEDNTVRVSLRIAGYSVFNRQLEITFDETNVQITGRWTFDTPYSIKSNLYAAYNPNDALIVFAGLCPDVQVQEVQPGLLLGDTAGNQLSLAPVWRILTDNGEFFVDPLKKSIL